MSNVNLSINSNLTLSNAPDHVIEYCVKDNTFANPLYATNELAGRSNWQTDREITAYKFMDGNLILPRGYGKKLINCLNEKGIDVDIIDERILAPSTFPALRGVTLRSYQQRAVDEALKESQGVIISPTGSGKTFIGLELIRHRAQKSLIIVHRTELAKQWVEVIAERMGIKAGFLGDGQWGIGEQITIGMVQTIAAKANGVFYAAFGLVLIDEGHHTPSSTFSDVIGQFPAKYRYSVTATPQRRDGLEPLIYLAVGPKIATISKQEVENIGATVPATVVSIQTGFNPGLVESWSEYLDSFTYDARRNELIIDLARKAEGPTLIIVDRVEHAKQISEMLERRKIDHVIAHGKISKKDREDVMERIKSARLTVGTFSLLGEGLDISVWGALIMGSPISSEIKLLQAIGRIVRPSIGKEKAMVYDLRDDCGFSGSSFKKRFEIYKKQKIWVNFPSENGTNEINKKAGRR